MILHVLVARRSIVGKVDAGRFLVAFSRYDGAKLCLVVKERTQADSENTRNLNQWCERGEVHVALDTRDLFYT